MKLTITLIGEAMKGNDFWLAPSSEAAKIIAEATQRGYLHRISHTQIEWTEEGLAKARRELRPIPKTQDTVKRVGAQDDETGTVLRVRKGDRPGGVKALVRVRWHKGGESTVEDRGLEVTDRRELIEAKLGTILLFVRTEALSEAQKIAREILEAV